MKLALLALFSCLSIVQASPYLVCDPYPNNAETGLDVASFVINGLTATAIKTPALINADGTQSLHFDLGTLALTNGTKYTITVAAINRYGFMSNPSTVVFTKGVPVPPVNLRISLN